MSDDPGNRTPTGKFGPANRANPSGRPKLVREFYDWMSEKAYPKAQKALLEALDDPKRSLAATELVYAYLIGRPKQSIDIRSESLHTRIDLSKLSPEQLRVLKEAHAIQATLAMEQEQLALPAKKDEEP